MMAQYQSHTSDTIAYISKKINLRPAASCPPCAPDVAGAYNVNSSSGCRRPGPHRPDVVGVRLDAPDATRSCPPQQPCALRTTLPSRYTPCTPRHATSFLTSCDFNLLLPNKPYNSPPSGFPPMLLCALRIPSCVPLPIPSPSRTPSDTLLFALYLSIPSCISPHPAGVLQPLTFSLTTSGS